MSLRTELKQIFDDKKLQKDLKNAAESFRDASVALREAPQQKKGLSFGRLGRQLGASWACSRLLITGAPGDCFVRPCAGPHPKGVMNVAAAGYSIREDVR